MLEHFQARRLLAEVTMPQRMDKLSGTSRLQPPCRSAARKSIPINRILRFRRWARRPLSSRKFRSVLAAARTGPIASASRDWKNALAICRPPRIPSQPLRNVPTRRMLQARRSSNPRAPGRMSANARLPSKTRTLLTARGGVA
ncbi:hypothetical protein U14_03180 [Candidatus Moduliflexus flocculans]|uniref:Uncharacterized protein n=1 Tax=Candidatus Moduliflexus flocculans TaxID=1499966 RepID=A0A081BNG8_9BACT|nr:hypothetical protein U14_03180 [Candidatus Moduliflexus flocculans]